MLGNRIHYICFRVRPNQMMLLGLFGVEPFDWPSVIHARVVSVVLLGPGLQPTTVAISPSPVLRPDSGILVLGRGVTFLIRFEATITLRPHAMRLCHLSLFPSIFSPRPG